MSRATVTTILELIGLALIVAGIALIWVPAAFIAAGAGLIVISYVITTRGGRT